MNSNRNDRNPNRDTGREERFEGRNSGYESEDRRGEHSDHSPGYSTANDFSGQDAARGRLRRSSQGRDSRGYGDEGYARYGARNSSNEYPDTYRSAASGYMSEYVGDDLGRRDYNDNDRGNPFYGGDTDYGRSAGRERQEEGRHKGKGPRDYRRTDTRIQEDINDRLTDDPHVDASDVDVTVQNGEVTLSGTVEDRTAKRRAEDIAESVSGVSHVENRMRIRSRANTNPPMVTPY